MANIVETAVAAGSFSTLVAAVLGGRTGRTRFRGQGPSRSSRPQMTRSRSCRLGTVEALPRRPAQADGDTHVSRDVPGMMMAADVVKATSLATVQGQSLTVKVNGEREGGRRNCGQDRHSHRQRRHPRDRQRAPAQVVARCLYERRQHPCRPAGYVSATGCFAFAACLRRYREDERGRTPAHQRAARFRVARRGRHLGRGCAVLLARRNRGSPRPRSSTSPPRAPPTSGRISRPIRA